MVKPQEGLGIELDRNGVTSEVNQEAWLLETPSYMSCHQGLRVTQQQLRTFDASGKEAGQL